MKNLRIIGLYLYVMATAACMTFTAITLLERNKPKPSKEIGTEFKEGSVHVITHYAVGLRPEDRAMINILYGNWIFNNNCYAPAGKCWLVGNVDGRKLTPNSWNELEGEIAKQGPNNITGWYVNAH